MTAEEARQTVVQGVETRGRVLRRGLMYGPQGISCAVGCLVFGLGADADRCLDRAELATRAGLDALNLWHLEGGLVAKKQTVKADAFRKQFCGLFVCTPFDYGAALRLILDNANVIAYRDRT